MLFRFGGDSPPTGWLEPSWINFLIHKNPREEESRYFPLAKLMQLRESKHIERAMSHREDVETYVLRLVPTTMPTPPRRLRNVPVWFSVTPLEFASKRKLCRASGWSCSRNLRKRQASGQSKSEDQF
mmetsp:Transcript_41146/g.162482  ORF Transcript_41146/g.162482 Transcript_41146/m.162482 type:complete len:127 (-) Transcript_41146:1040-1420(-)